MRDLNTAEINVHYDLNRLLVLYEFEVGNNASEATKTICCLKGEVLVDHSTVIRWLKKFHLVCNELDNQAKSSRTIIINSEAVPRALKVTPERIKWTQNFTAQCRSLSTWSQQRKPRTYWIMPHVTKIMQNFNSLLNRGHKIMLNAYYVKVKRNNQSYKWLLNVDL